MTNERQEMSERVREIIETASIFAGEEGRARWTGIFENEGEEAVVEEWEKVKGLMDTAAKAKPPRYKDDLKSQCKCGGCADCLGQ